MLEEFHFSRDDLPPDFREIADVLDDATTALLIEHFGGQLLYIPKRDTIERTARNRAIRKSYYSGLSSGRVLSRKYHLSTRQIQRILAKKTP